MEGGLSINRCRRWEEGELGGEVTASDGSVVRSTCAYLHYSVSPMVLDYFFTNTSNESNVYVSFHWQITPERDTTLLRYDIYGTTCLCNFSSPLPYHLLSTSSSKLLVSSCLFRLWSATVTAGGSRLLAALLLAVELGLAGEGSLAGEVAIDGLGLVADELLELLLGRLERNAHLGWYGQSFSWGNDHEGCSDRCYDRACC